MLTTVFGSLQDITFFFLPLLTFLSGSLSVLIAVVVVVLQSLVNCVAQAFHLNRRKEISRKIYFFVAVLVFSFCLFVCFLLTPNQP